MVAVDRGSARYRQTILGIDFAITELLPDARSSLPVKLAV